jgi:hypothetical protein
MQYMFIVHQFMSIIDYIKTQKTKKVTFFEWGNKNWEEISVVSLKNINDLVTFSLSVHIVRILI